MYTRQRNVTNVLRIANVTDWNRRAARERWTWVSVDLDVNRKDDSMDGSVEDSNEQSKWN